MGAVVGAGASPPLPSSLAGRLREARALLLPYGYPSTVASSYAAYAGLAFCGSVFSSAAGVLSTQSLLLAVGVGAGAVPLAAALNWVLKDGLGQLGGVLAAALIRNRFDSDPKRWRLAAAVAQDAASLLEIATPLLPGAFLPLAAAANVGKNVAWLSASATRASLHSALALRGNLADVTAKAGSQSIAASVVGTALGIALSGAVGSAPQDILAAFAALSAAHLAGVYASLKCIALPTLSAARLDLAIDAWVRACPRERDSSGAGMPVPALHVRTPVEVAALEGFLPWQSPAAAAAVASVSAPHSICVGGDVTMLDDADFARFADLSGLWGSGTGSTTAAAGSENSRYLLGVARTRPRELQLFFAADAQWADVLTGYLHAMRLRALLDAGAVEGENAESITARDAALAESRAWTLRHAPAAMAALDAAGFWVGTPLIDLRPQRRLAVRVVDEVKI